MKQAIRFGLTLCLLLTMGLASTVPVAYAADPLADVCDTAPDSPTCKSRTTENPLTGTDGILYNVAEIVAVVAGIGAIIIILISGFRYITSGGDTQKVTSAKHTLVGAIIGLVIIVLAQTIITYVIKRIGT
ncbi:hypothetical protein IPL85_02020 [Candidatus Saccharibacteria bacterium]|nr:MAG: hypothetical protein IPL85_02020 [Candidatus Saccharibacteria bacterium]